MVFELSRKVIVMNRIVVVFLAGMFVLAPLGSRSAQAVAQGAPAAPAPHPSTQDPSVLVTPEQMKAWETELSNWGRWGPDDQRGRLNLITPEKTR